MTHDLPLLTRRAMDHGFLVVVHNYARYAEDLRYVLYAHGSDEMRNVLFNWRYAQEPVPPMRMLEIVYYAKQLLNEARNCAETTSQIRRLQFDDTNAWLNRMVTDIQHEIGGT